MNYPFMRNDEESQSTKMYTLDTMITLNSRITYTDSIGRKCHYYLNSYVYDML